MVIQHETCGFTWQHLLPVDLPWHVPFTPSHQTLQHHSQGCSRTLVTQETASRCWSRWPGRAGSHESPSSPLSWRSPSRVFTEVAAGEDASGSLFQHAHLLVLGAASEEQRGRLLC